MSSGVGSTICAERWGDILVHGLGDFNRVMVGHIVVVGACYRTHVVASADVSAMTKPTLV